MTSRDWLALPAPPAGTRDPDPRGDLDRKPSFADYPERDQILRANVCEFRRGYARARQCVGAGAGQSH